MARTLISLLAAALVAGAAAAQEPRFRFAVGDGFATNVEQTTAVTETRPAEALTSSVKLTLTRRWAVRAVDAAGVATLDLTVSAMKQEITPATPAGQRVEAITVDSATPEGRAALKDVFNRVLMTVKLDPSGKLVSAEANGGMPTGRLDAELPFRLAWPAGPVAVNAPWTRPVTLTLDPPHGTGEKVELVQTCTLKGAKQGIWVVGVSIAPKAESRDPAVRLAVAPVLWAGEVDYDPATGRYAGCRLKVAREVDEFAGPGTKFRYESTLVETPAK